MKLRSLFLLVALLAAMFVGAVSAQDEMPFDPCFGLSADDCAYINDASAADMGAINNLTFTMDIAFSATGIPGATPEDPTSSLTFNLNTAIDIVEGQNPALPVNAGGVINVDFNDGMSGDSLAIDLSLVDGIFYILDPTTGQYQGIDLVAAMSDPTFLEQFGLDATAPDLGLGAMTGMDMSNMDMEALASLVDLVNLPGLITYTRDGQVFTFTIDLTTMAILLTPEYEEQLNTIVEAVSAIDPSLGMFIPLIPTVLKEGTITITQTVNAELNAVDTIGFAVDARVDTAMLSGVADSEPVVVTLDVTLNIGNFGGASQPAAPAEFEMLDLGGAGQ